MARTSSWKKKKGGKRGNQGVFKGLRLEFLLESFPDYRKAAKKRKYKPFWARVLALYWEKFPWWIPLNVEPNEENMVPPELITEELLAQKEKVVKASTKVSQLL